MPGLHPAPGSVVLIRHQRWRVQHVRHNRDVVRLDVLNRRRAMTFLAPFDRADLLAVRRTPRRVRRQRLLARLALLVGRTTGYREPASALDARVDLLAYQLEPTLALQGGQRRLLLADEVGLGKTVQAGLAVAEVIRRDAGARVLILVPPSLIDQWCSELSLRLHLHPERANQQHLASLERHAGFGWNPWRQHRVWIASLDFLKQPHVLSSLPAIAWDLLVVDEAHEAAGDSERSTACHELGRRSRRLLLLTATPHSGDPDRFARLLHLGALPSDDGPPMVLRRTKRQLGLENKRRVRWCRFRASRTETRLLDALLAFERRVRGGHHDHASAAHLLLAVFRKRALSTAAALRRTVDRRLEWLSRADQDDRPDWLQPVLRFDDGRDDLSSADALALTGNVGIDRPVELSWLRRLRGLAADSERHDSRVARLVRLLSATGEPVVVFTEFRDSLVVVRRALEMKRSVTQLHGSQSPAERRDALNRFLGGAADTLLATDVAGIGLNLQSRSRWVVNLELPWNPVRLEQRAGRVDRIGQARPVRISLMACRHPAESHLVAHLAGRVLAARGRLGDDILQSTLPDEQSIRCAVLAQDSVPTPATSELTPSTPGTAPRTAPLANNRRWQRAAQVATQSLARRRALIGRWRIPESETHRPVWSAARSRPFRQRLGQGLCLVFAVPLLDGLGGLLESRLVIVRARLLRRPAPHAVPRDLVMHARRLAAGQARARMRRLTRVLEFERRREQVHSGDVLGHLRDGLGFDRVSQAGLFDARALQAARTADADDAALLAAYRLRVGDARLRSQVVMGDPVLEAVFTS